MKTTPEKLVELEGLAVHLEKTGFLFTPELLTFTKAIPGLVADFKALKEERDEAEKRVALLEAAIDKARDDALEAAAKACEKRAAERFQEHGITEYDTNASYYPESHEWCETADEECEANAAAIRKLKVVKP